MRIFVKEGWVNRETGKKGEPRLQFNGIQMLQDVMESQAKKLTIQIPVEEISEERIRYLKEMLNTHKGDRHLQFVIYEVEEKVKLVMSAKKQKVAISNELLEELEKEQVRFKLN